MGDDLPVSPAGRSTVDHREGGALFDEGEDGTVDAEYLAAMFERMIRRGQVDYRQMGDAGS